MQQGSDFSVPAFQMQDLLKAHDVCGVHEAMIDLDEFEEEGAGDVACLDGDDYVETSTGTAACCCSGDMYSMATCRNASCSCGYSMATCRNATCSCGCSKEHSLGA